MRLLRLLIFAGLVLLSGPSWAATLGSDAFTGTNGTILPSHDANWSAAVNLNVSQIQSNRAANTSTDQNVYGGITWPNDQWAQMTIITVADTYQGVSLRSDTAQQNYYVCGIAPGQLANSKYHIWKVVASTYTGIWTHASQTMAANDVVYCEIQGTTIILKVNGSDITGGGITDSAIASGSAGFRQQDSTTLIGVVEDWSGGDFSGAAATRALMMMGAGQ